MPLKLKKREVEAERAVGYRRVQALVRTEALVPNAGRETIDVLLRDANVVVIHTDVQTDRVVLDGNISCQVVYRQGEESSLRALGAKTVFSQVAEIAGTQAGMPVRVLPVVESVEARYENGHMVFQVSLAIDVWVWQLDKVSLTDGIEGTGAVEVLRRELHLEKLAAEANETVMLSERVELPQAIDARTALMDWGSVTVESVEADLGGLRAKGRATIETLISGGHAEHPAVLVRYPLEFDRLLELPEWLTREAAVRAEVRDVRTQVEQASGEEPAYLSISAELRFDIAANLSEDAQVVADAYAAGDTTLNVERRELEYCTGVRITLTGETVRATAQLEAGMTPVAEVIAVHMRPQIGEIGAEEGGTRIRGLLDAEVLYQTGAEGHLRTTQSEMEFTALIPQEIREDSLVRVRVLSAEANALMSNRLEMKAVLEILCESRLYHRESILAEAVQGEARARRPGYIVYWPQAEEDAWAVGKRYGIAEADVLEAAGDALAPGKPLVLRV